MPSLNKTHSVILKGIQESGLNSWTALKEQTDQAQPLEYRSVQA